MAGLDEFLIGACLRGRRPLSKLPWESSDGDNTDNQEREGSPKHQQVEVVEEKAWNDWSSDTKQPEQHNSYGLHGKSSVDDGSIVSKELGDEIMAKVTLGELSMTEILYGHGYKARSEPKQPVDENKIVDLGFEDSFTRGNLDTSYSLQSEIYNTPSFLRETSSNSAQSTKNPSFLDSTEPGTSMSSSPTRSAFKDNPCQIIDVGFTELPKTPKLNMPKMLSANEIVDVGLKEYKPFRHDIKARLENSIDFANPSTDVGYAPSFSNSDTSDRNKADTKIRSFSDRNYVDVKTTSQSISSSYTEIVPKLKSETSIIFNALRNECKKTTDPTVEPFYSKPPVVNTASFRLSSPSYSNTQYDKRSDQNIATMFYSNPTLITKTTQDVVTRPDIVPAKQPSSMSVTMEMKDTNLIYDEYKPFRPDIKASLENSIDFANPITDVGYVPSFSDSDVCDRSNADNNIQSFSDSNYFGVKKTSQSNSSSYTGIVPNLKSETSISFNDLKTACKKTTDPSVEHCFSKSPVVNTESFRLSSPSYSNSQYDKRSDPDIATMYYSNPTRVIKTTHEVTRPDIVPAKQQSSMSVTMEIKDTNLLYLANALSASSGNVKRSTNSIDIDESKQVSEVSNQSRSSTSIHKVSTERNGTVSCLTGLSEQIDNTDVSHGHDTENNEVNRDCRKTSRGRKFIDFIKSLFCCKRKNKPFDVDD